MPENARKYCTVAAVKYAMNCCYSLHYFVIAVV